MRQDLDTLKKEILEYLKAQDFIIFYGFSRHTDAQPVAYWDVHRHPDYQAFLAAAREAGVRLVTFHQREFSNEEVEEALDRLEDCDLSSEDRRRLEHRLHEMEAYSGFTCIIELSFAHDGRLYMYDLHTGWYMEFLDTMDEIDSCFPGDEEEEEGPIGGYFSRN
jgi:hypothetical protein